MSAYLNVLLIEDDDRNIESWNDNVALHNADSDAKGYKIRSSCAKSTSEAKQALEAGRIDAVIVDLRLQADHEGPSEPNDHGNALVQYIRENHPAGLAIYTGQPQEADTAGVPQIEVFDRGQGLEQIFSWLTRQKDMLLNVQRTRQEVDKETARVFFRSIWPRWTRWNVRENDELQRALARHVVAHVHDAMLDAGGGTAHPEETYFIPPLKPRLDTGDIVRLDDQLWIVVTPRCDLANVGKINTILLAHCVDIKDQWAVANEKAKKKFIQHDGAAKQHFLPPVDMDGSSQGPWFVTFHNLKTIPIADAESQLMPNRFASVAPQFVPSLVERFGAYFSRIGTPNLSSE